MYGSTTSTSAFLSTLPARGATVTTNGSISGDYEFLSTLPARGATQEQAQAAAGSAISIHAPREGSDMAAFADAIRGGVFLSTLPARGATIFKAARRSVA